MKRYISILAIFSFILSGCSSTFYFVEPIYPEVVRPDDPKIVDSLKPTFQWKPLEEKDVTYDLIVYEAIIEETFWKTIRRTVGREIYYREALEMPNHRIEKLLKPDTEYFWSVRTRQGDKVSKWAIYDYLEFIAGKKWFDQPFIFKTPKQIE